MALPAKGTLGQVVAYNGYNYKWTGTSWLNIGAASTSTGNTTTNTAVSANGVTTGNTTTNTAITANGVSTGNTTTNTAITANGISTGNSTSNTTVSANGVAVGNTAVTANGVSVGNTAISANGVSVGNTAITANGVAVGNTSVTANGVSVGNTSISTNGVAVGQTSISANGVAVGQTSVSNTGVSVGNTKLSSNGLAVGNTAISGNGVAVGNSSISSNGVTTGNSTANVTINSTAVAIGTAVINSTFFSGTANNALYLGNIVANDYLLRTGNQVIPGIYTYTNILNANVANFAGDVVISNNLTVTGSLTFSGQATVVDTQDVSVSNSILSIHSPPALAPLTYDDGRLLGLAIHYFDSVDKQALLAVNQSNGFLTYYQTSTDVINGDPTGIALGTIQAGELHIGNGIVYTTVNATNFTGTANNTLYVGSTPAQYIVNTAQISNLATKNSVTANAATAYSNAVSYIDAAIASINTTVTGLGGGGDQAYANMIAYIENQYFVNTAQLSSNIGQFSITQEYVVETAFNAATEAYANTIGWIGLQPFVYTPDLINFASKQDALEYADLAYSNAVAYVTGLPLVNSSQLEANLNNYATTAYTISAAGLAADQAYANALIYIDSQSSLVTIESVVANSASAYSNAVGWVEGQGYINFNQLNLILDNYITTTDGQQYINTSSIDSYLFVNSSQLEANLAAVPNTQYVVEAAAVAASEAYANALVYIDSQTSLATTEAIVGNAATAYANAISYVSGQGYINYSELNTVLNNYASIQSVAQVAQAANAAYSNAISYVDSALVAYPNTAYVIDAASVAASEAYANALIYIDSQTSLVSPQSVEANAAAAYANAISYIDGRGYAGFNEINLLLNGYASIESVNQVAQSAANAYSNAVGYTDNLFQSVPSQAYVIDTAYNAADQAYANAIIYVDAATGGATSEAIIANAASAYSNAIGYVTEQGFITGTQLQGNLASYSTATQVIEYVTGLQYANVQQVSAIVEGYNYVNNSTLQANYANVEYTVSLLDNSLSYIGEQAYTNAIAYVDGSFFVNSAQLSANLTNYTSVSILPLISANADTAYANAVGYIDSRSYVNTSQLAANYINLTNNYTITGVHTHNANLVINRVVIINGDVGIPGQVLTSNGSSNVYWSTPSTGGTGGGFDGGTPFTTYVDGGTIFDAGGVI